jgi:hypothetical protein
LNTRQLNANKPPQVTTIKQIKTTPKVQILNTSSLTHNQQIVSVLPATIIAQKGNSPIQQQPQAVAAPIVFTTNPSSLNTKFLSIQPVNKVIAIAPQSKINENDNAGGSMAKRIKIEDGAVSPASTRNNIKPLAPKIKHDSPAVALKQTNMNRSSSIEMIVQPTVNQQQQQQVPSIATILYSTESQQPQTTLCFDDTNSVSSDVNSSGENSLYLSSLSKKQFRMMKNRESACLSRKRKKEVSKVEEQCFLPKHQNNV